MKRLLILLLSTSFLTANAQKAKSDKRFEGLDTAFARVLSEWKAAGFAVAVVDKNKVVYSKGFGYSDYENKVPATTNSVFAIGSCTKAFTASLLGILQSEKKVDFDAPVRQYLPELFFYNNELNDHVTLRDMMSHRTGLPRHDFSWYLFQSHSMDTLIKRIKYQEPTVALRQKWQYNNFMYMLQGAVAQQLTGKSWEENIREKIFKPLGMSGSDVSLAEWKRDKNAAKGYTVKDEKIHRLPYYDIAAMAPAGSINSSVEDMAKWVTTWINGGKYQGKEVLPAAYIQDAMSSQMVINSGLPNMKHPDNYLSNYGLGWGLSSYRGHYRVEHGGNIDGFSASTSFFPTDSVGIVVLCNQDGSPIPSVVRNMLADRMLKLKLNDWQSEIKAASDTAKKQAKDIEKNMVSKQVKNTLPSHSLKDYTGTYTHPGYGSFTISLVKDSLKVRAGVKNLWLKHYHYDVFQPYEIDAETGIDTGASMVPKFRFGMTNDGEIANVNVQLEGGLDPFVFEREPATVTISADSLEKYVGEYTLSGLIIKIFVRDGTLMMFVPGQPEYELLPLSDDRFSLKTLTGYTVQFNKDASSKIIELLAQQPNGTFKAVKKQD